MSLEEERIGSEFQKHSNLMTKVANKAVAARHSSNPLCIPVLDPKFYNVDLSIDISETISPSLSR